MIIDFSVTNFRSIKEEQTLSLYVEQRGEHLPKHVCYPANDKIGVLTSAGFYGANASGKSNFLFAFFALQKIIMFSETLREDAPIPFYEPFLLSEETKTAVSRFEIEFFCKKIRYRYEVSFNQFQIEEESLIFYPSNQPATIFKREASDNWKTIKFGTLYKGGKRRVPFFKNNAYLSVAGSKADAPEMIRDIYKYFRAGIFHLGTNENILVDWYSDKNISNQISLLLSLVDTGVSGLFLKENRDATEFAHFPSNMPEELKVVLTQRMKYKIMFLHANESGELIQFDEEKESEGTKKLFNLAPLLLDALANGKVIVIDELDNNMHPFMAELIVKLFNDSRVNKNNAQLIFSTHNISLMSPEYFRRDQIWFTEKNNGVTTCYSLDDFDKKKVKPKSSFNQWYAEGRFGAIPIIDYEGIVELFNKNNDEANHA